MNLAALDRPYDTLLVREPEPRILQVTLNRPERANAFTTRMGEELTGVFGALEAESGAYRCIVLTGAGGTQNLPRAIGERRAKELVFTGRPFSAEEALAWGVVNRLCPPGEVLAAALETARAIRDNAPLSVRQAKKAITAGLQMDRASGMLFEIEAYYQLIPTEDRLEGINAYVEMRKPVFKGR